MSFYRKIILGFFGASFLGVSVLAAMFFHDTGAEFKALQARERQVTTQVDLLERKLAEQKDLLERLQHDPLTIERTIRSRLGYSRPGELVFRFRDE